MRCQVALSDDLAARIPGLAGTLAGAATTVAIGWIVLAIGLNSAGELLVSPTGLSMIIGYQINGSWAS